MKTCSICKKSLVLSAFGKDSKQKSGLCQYCKECSAKYQRDWRKNNREKHLETRAEWMKHNGESYREQRLLARYGLTLDQYKEMSDAQSGCCAICGEVPSTRKLSVDHCHRTGTIRGLLCTTCNLALGNVKDSVVLLENMLLYLRTSP